jgi:hypothetical protein
LPSWKSWLNILGTLAGIALGIYAIADHGEDKGREDQSLQDLKTSVDTELSGLKQWQQSTTDWQHTDHDQLMNAEGDIKVLNQRLNDQQQH